MRKSFCALALVVFASLLAGCFEHPLTERPSKDINTWLLGVWEYKDAKTDRTYRAAFLPLTGDRYTVWVRELGKRPKDTKEWQFEAWISRVGNSQFLTFKCLKSDGKIPEGSYVFAHYTVFAQNDVAVRTLQLDSPPEATSYQLRQEVREKLKTKTLYPEAAAIWTRISEVYWQKEGDPLSQPLIPLNYPNAPEFNKKDKERAEKGTLQQKVGTEN